MFDLFSNRPSLKMTDAFASAPTKCTTLWRKHLYGPDKSYYSYSISVVCITCTYRH